MEKILVVEDEEVIRSALRRLLERNGYTVTEADSVPSALQLSLASFDLIISDLRLPGAAGTDLISHTGDVLPSGFLPLVAGNVRHASPLRIYRESPLFRRLREPEHFAGRCGRCAFAAECGGSRARAFAAFGDPFGEDPLCA